MAMKNPKDIMIGKRTLADVLERHKHWLNQDCEGWEDMRAILDGASLDGASLDGASLNRASLNRASLNYASLNYASLNRASLNYASLNRASLNGASLDGASLNRASLNRASLNYASLNYASLNRASLNRASLDSASLNGASLDGASLNGASLDGASLNRASLNRASLDGASLDGASLDGASLDGASLNHAKSIPYIPMICPEEGTFIGWKKVMIQGGSFLAKLEIPEDAARSSATTRKCRASKAKVLGLYRLGGERLDDDVEAVSIHNNSFIYKAGTVVIPDEWDDNRWEECSHGIHFFMQRQEAINY